MKWTHTHDTIWVPGFKSKSVLFCFLQNNMAAKSATKKTAGTRRHKPKRTWSIFIHRTLKQVHKDVGMSSKAMRVVNSFCQDIIERVAVEAAALTRFNNSKTMKSHDIQTAVRLVLPTELAKHAMAEGTKAVAKFSGSSK